ncbi:circadian locomoter output cycles protein kaput isoform X2 [Macrosteles quadrilineatus]|uniref:circadian locomoter output cycles protein kaput-like n=1 Tax=Macrosteles quadrilineatus TaxID=74068 RepID=UPI0023E0FADA|nr:circadian locomoter output cycles protein kaput-like [Macrosteles quadrilineatus]XP_054289507.1 circadian locomoter output cycles protein kaput isoform X2 [Macrosteles quadrilineatus]
MSGFMSQMSRCSTGGRRSEDTMDDDTDDKDDTKRKSRNLSEKKRRDQFNLLINELSSMVSTNSRKMDKSTVLKSTISFLKNHNDLAVRSRVHEIQEEWKPAFLSNEEFTHLILEALDGFIMVFSSSGRILYASESITALLGHLPNDLLNMTIYDVVYDEDQSQLYNMFLNPVTNVLYENNKDNQVAFVCHCKRGSLDFSEEVTYELVRFVGYFRADMESLQIDGGGNNRYSGYSGEADTRLVFVGTGRLQTPQLIREMSIVDSSKSEFTSRHSLEWKFLFLDHRASQIIGYLPFEVLGTSGYDYYHVDDLDKVIMCHEALMQKGEGTSCYYRFLTKGQQWIWLQTRFYITYHQWNSKPEFVVCTHRVISHINVVKQLRKDPDSSAEQSQEAPFSREPPRESSPWASNSRSPGNKNSQQYDMKRFPTPSRGGGESDTSLSADSVASRHSQITSPSVRSRCVSTTGSKMAAPTTKSTPVPEFIEPPATYAVTAIPLQPVAFAAPTTLVTTVPTSEVPLRQPLVMSSSQSQIQDQLQKKHEQLQQLIVQQQEELRRVSEQLFMARYGLLQPLINVTMPYTVPATAPHLTVAATTPAEIFVPGHPVQRPHIMIDPHQVNYQQAQSSDEAMQHFQFPVQQAQQLLFSQNLDSPNSTQHSQ